VGSTPSIGTTFIWENDDTGGVPKDSQNISAQFEAGTEVESERPLRFPKRFKHRGKTVVSIYHKPDRAYVVYWAIILKDGSIADPYVIDFGISFDSRQTVALTREGEMFRNEFIILPEYQDLEGGHRELLSDITALVGVFFSCLTGRPPVVLLDAAELPPHRRHEELVVKSASSIEESEKLMWFFRRGFAFRPSNRFQSMAEFTTELGRFADGSQGVGLDAIEQFKIFDRTAKSKDRNLQLILLARKYQGLAEGVAQQLTDRFRSLHEMEGAFSHFGFQLQTDLTQSLPAGDLFSGTNIHGFQIYRQNFSQTAVVLLIGMAQQLDLHLYISGYVGTLNDPTRPTKKIVWERVAVIDSTQEAPSDRIIDVVVNAVDQRLARELRNLANQT
jgi:hypothetical protein